MATALTHAVRGGGLVLLGSAAGAIIQFVGVVVLSRLLDPGDFGLVAMIAVFVTLGNLLRDFGMPQAALQSPTLSEQQSSNIFWVNAGLAIVGGAGLAVCAPLLVALYSEPRLGLVAPVMALGIVFTGTSAQLQIRLARSRRYGALAATDVIAQSLGLCAAISLALFGAGYWALVGQTLITALSLLIGRATACKWRPRRFRRGHGTKAFLRSGGQYGVAHLLTFAQNNADSLVIGARLGADELGVYSRAFQVLTAPAALALAPLTNVVVPMANTARSEGRAVWPILLRSQFYVGFLMAWVFAMTGGMAPVVIPLVLGPGWDGAVSVFRILAIGGVVSSLSTVSYWGFVCFQRSRELLFYNIITKPMAVLLVLVGSQFGINGVAGAYALALAISWPINLWWLAKSDGLPIGEFFKSGLAVLGCALSGAFLSRGVLGYIVAPPVVEILIGLACGTAGMVAVGLMMPQTRSGVRGVLAGIMARCHDFGKRRHDASH